MANVHRGVLFLFATSALTWSSASGQFSQQGGLLIGAGSAGIANQGQSLALSGDGNTAIVGGPFDSSGTGAAWIFVRVNGAWVSQGEKLLAQGSVPGTIGPRQGTSVALSSDGNTAIVGGSGDNSGTGAAWVFTRTNGAWTQQGGKLVGTGAADGFVGARQGESVALSADGNTAAVGGPLDGSGTGAVWVFQRTNGVWTQQVGKIIANTASGEALQGWSVALSGDGNTLLEGGIYDFNNAGAAWIFVRSNGTWSQQGFKLYGLDAGEGANQGWAVALSGDGNRAIMGGNGDIGGIGAAWVFTRSNGVWSQEGGKIVGTGASGPAGQGASVALSSDGNTAIVGGPADSLGLGASWVFTRDAGTWSQQGDKIVGAGASIGDFGSNQGAAVALASDGNTAMIGAPEDNEGTGAAWVFNRSGSSWTQSGGKYIGTGARGNASQGESVSLSGDGNTVIVGGPNDGTGEGASWMFTRSGGAWSQAGDKLVGRGTGGNAKQGTSVSLSSDGNTAAIGGPADSTRTGAVWVFTRQTSTWIQQGEKLVGTGGVKGITGIAMGGSVSLSADGNTLLAGGPGDSSGAGAAWVFTRNTGTWTQQGSKLFGTGSAGKANRGASVSLSADGNTAIVGGPADNAGAGASWVFVRSGGAWAQQGGKLIGKGGIGTQGQGGSVSISADGSTALVGGPNDSSGRGAAWAFSRSGGVWSQTGGKLTGTDSDPSAGFGGSLSLSADGNTAIIGGSNDNLSVGAVWLFSRTGGSWIQLGNKIVGSGGSGSPQGGTSAALSGDGNTFLAGGPGNNSGEGAAWAFVRNTSGVPGSGGGSPRISSLAQNYPNPFNPATTIRFEVPSSGKVSLVVYTLLGERVTELASGPFKSGTYTVRFDASGLSSGTYVCVLRAGDSRKAIKMLLVR